MPVTEDTWRLLLDGGDRDAMFPWRWFAVVVEETVLDGSVIS
ncbi:hypothetical protein [Methylobacterium sp. 285MFTsu5.1]|nr:hypothetical protein [Methylobacterium sp. 285MFTsu5.1]